MAQGPTVESSDVFVVQETETALLCRIGEKFHWVAHGRLQPGSTVEHPGDLGVLMLPWDFAVEFWDGGAMAPDDRATVHPVHRARRDREPSRLRQANLLTAAPLSPHDA